MIEAMMDVSGWQDYIGTENTVQKLAAADLPNRKNRLPCRARKAEFPL
jgi:hypothetical protein